MDNSSTASDPFNGKLQPIAFVALLWGWSLAACSGEFGMANKVLFSAVTGTVLLDGQPVAEAVVERQFEWNDERGRDTTITGSDGRFALPSIERKSGFLDRVLPSEPLVKQTISISHGGKAHQAWYFFKRNFRNNGELDGRPIRLTCRLEAEPVKRGEVFGIGEIE